MDPEINFEHHQVSHQKKKKIQIKDFYTREPGLVFNIFRKKIAEKIQINVITENTVDTYFGHWGSEYTMIKILIFPPCAHK